MQVVIRPLQEHRLSSAGRHQATVQEHKLSTVGRHQANVQENKLPSVGHQANVQENKLSSIGRHQATVQEHESIQQLSIMRSDISYRAASNEEIRKRIATYLKFVIRQGRPLCLLVLDIKTLSYANFSHVMNYSLS